MNLKIFAPLLALVCVACSKPAPETVLVQAEPTPLPRPAECDPSRDPKWTRLPQRALTKSDLARGDNANGRAFDRLAGKRRACWDVLNAD